MLFRSDATNKWPGETDREWGRVITMPEAVQRRADSVVEAILASAKTR